MKRTCPGCESVFVAESKRQVWCSAFCRSARSGPPCYVCGVRTSKGCGANGRAKHQSCFEHGTAYGYANHGCRCVLCTEANRDVCRVFRERRAAEGRPVVYRRATVERVCPGCGEPFGARVDALNEGKGVYCSRRCRTLFESGVDTDAPDYVKPNRFRVSESFRVSILERDGYVCWLCGEATRPDVESQDDKYPTLDHVVPRSRGGSDDPSNLRCAHRLCNSLRGAPEVTCEVAVGNSQMALW